MFTGIVTAVGQIRKREPMDSGLRLFVDTPEGFLDGARTGDSIAVSGVCLTRTGGDAVQLVAELSSETLELTTLGELQEGETVNLERALKLGDELGGHIVSGHVDGLARVLSRRPDGVSQRFDFEAPPELARFIAAKGSVCLDGVSLTVNDAEGTRFGVCIIPHTLECTTLTRLQEGQRVNLEIDLLARYAERLLAVDAS